MKKKRFIFLFFSFSILLFSCKKEESNVGKDGLNSNQYLDSDAIDTFALNSYMFLEDSLLSSNLSSALLGSYVDPVFGKVEAEFYTQFELEGLAPDFGDVSTIKIDSFVLGLEYVNYYGNFDPQTFEVYQLQEDLFLDSSYFSFQTKSVSSTNLMQAGKSLITPTPDKTTIIAGKEVESQLRLYIDTNLARSLILEASTNPTNFATNENFQTYFKGLNVRVNNPSQASGEGAIYYFNLNDPLSKLTIYYTQAGLQKTFDFLINSDCADFNHIVSTNSATIQNIIDNPSAGNVEFYAQANKSRAVIEFTSIDNIPKNAYIHYAQLELPVSYYTYSSYFPSSLISVARFESKTSKKLLSTGSTGDFSNYTKKYTIDIRNYVQQIVNQEIENTGVVLSPAKMLTSSERIIFNGINTTNKEKPKLKIIYTIF